MSIDHSAAAVRVTAGVDWAKDDHAIAIIDPETRDHMGAQFDHLGDNVGDTVRGATPY